MKSGFRVGLLFGLAALIASASARDRWLYAKSDNFEMFSSASEKDSRRLLSKLEQFRAFFLASLPLRRAREPRTVVMVFDSDRAFRDYKPLYRGKPKDVGGYFTGANDEVVMAMTTDIDPDAVDDPVEVIFHEYVHLMMATRGLHPPLWLNEGMAELYSTFTIDGNTVELGKAKDIYAEFLANSAFTPLAKVISVDEDSPEYNEEDKADYFYAESWALTHYLVCGSDRTNVAKLVKYLRLMEDAAPGTAEAKFKEAFGKSYLEMQYDLRRYLDGGRYFKRIGKLPLPDLEKRLVFRPATDFERDVALLDLKWRVRQPASATGEALQLAERNPTSPRPQELLGAIYDRDDQRVEAEQHWRRAAELHTDNPYVYVRLARGLLSGVNPRGRSDDVLAPAVVAQLRAWLDQALVVNPDSADALEALALTEAVAPQIRVSAVNRVQAGLSRIKDPLQTLCALGIIRLRLGDPTTAVKIADLVLADRKAPKGIQGAAKEIRQRATAALGVPAPAKPTDAARGTDSAP